MKAAEFYQHWNELVRDNWSALGLSPLTKRGSKWIRPVGDLKLVFQVQVNIKYSWSVESGGDFSAYAFLPREVPAAPEKYIDNIMDEIHIFGTLDDALLAELNDLNQRTLDRLRGFDRAWIYDRIAKAYDCTPDQARELELFETGLETLELELDVPPESLVNPPLLYYDTDDLGPWAEWFSRALPVILDKIDTAPKYAFGGGHT